MKENEEADRVAKQTIDMPKLPYSYYNLTIRRSRNSEWQNWETAHNSCRQFRLR